MKLYPYSIIWKEDDPLVYSGMEFGNIHKAPQITGDIYFIITKDGYMINIPDDVNVLVRPRGTRRHEWKPVKEVAENYNDYGLILTRSTFDIWKEKVFSRLVFKKSLKEIINFAFFIGVKYNKAKTYKTNEKLNKYIKHWNQEQFSIFLKSYKSVEEFNNTINTIKDFIFNVINLIDKDDYVNPEPIEKRINRLLGLLLLTTTMFGYGKNVVLEIAGVSDDRLIQLQHEFMNVGITSTFNNEKSIITVNTKKFMRNMTMITEVLFKINKKDRNLYKQEISRVELIKDVSLYDVPVEKLVIDSTPVKKIT